MLKFRKYPHSGFTLIELLVVVLIIGILAAIALPQYKMAVGKAKFAELKSLTKTVAESAQRFYLLNNAYPSKYEDLDIEIDKLSNPESYFSRNEFSFTLSNGVRCTIWRNSGSSYNTRCSKTIFDKTIAYYIHRDTFRPLLCLAYSKNTSDNANLLCQKDTGKKTGKEYSDYYAYQY